MIEEHILTFVIVNIVALVGGFFWGLVYEQSKRRRGLLWEHKNFQNPKRSGSDHLDAVQKGFNDLLLSGWYRSLPEWQKRMHRGMQNVYSTDWHRDRPPFLPDSDDDKPN